MKTSLGEKEIITGSFKSVLNEVSLEQKVEMSEKNTFYFKVNSFLEGNVVC